MIINTIQGWYHSEAKPHEKANIARVLQMKFTPRILHWSMIEVLMRSKAETRDRPHAGLSGFREEGRMNTPATKVENWQWRLRANTFDNTIKPEDRSITIKQIGGRMNKQLLTLVIVLILGGLVVGAKFFLSPKKVEINYRKPVPREIGCSCQDRGIHRFSIARPAPMASKYLKTVFDLHPNDIICR